MATSTESNTSVGSDLPEPRPIDGTGNDKYYVPPEEASDTRFARQPLHKHSEADGAFAEHEFTLPERTYKDGDKEAFQITYPVGYLDQKKAKDAKGGSESVKEDGSRFKIKKWHLIVGVLVTVIVIIVTAVLGVVLSRNRSKAGGEGTAAPAQPSATVNASVVDTDSSVGGYLNPDYYAKSGAWNGTGIAVTSSPTYLDGNGLWIFYQSYNGSILYRAWSHTTNKTSSQSISTPLDYDSQKPLNGTPLSVIQFQLGSILEWHLFYIDVDYYLRERIINNVTMVWADGPLSRKDLQTFMANKVGLHACYKANYYGQYSNNGTEATAGASIFYASDKTVIQQYSWENGTGSWVYDYQFNASDGHTSFGCQTWYGQTEYLFYVNTRQNMGIYWKDNNRSDIETVDHPVGEWTTTDIGIAGLYKASALGFTQYLVYQNNDRSITGVNITFAAENTTIATGNSEGLDAWTLQVDGEDVKALGGTQLSITAIATAAGDAQLLAFFQVGGDEISVYTRDAFNEGGLWQKLDNAV